MDKLISFANDIVFFMATKCEQQQHWMNILGFDEVRQCDIIKAVNVITGYRTEKAVGNQRLVFNMKETIYL